MIAEFFGTIRIRAGAASLELDAATLGEALNRLAEAFPSLNGTVIFGDSVHRAFRVSLNGDRFVSDPKTPLQDADRLLLLSADMGG